MKLVVIDDSRIVRERVIEFLGELSGVREMRQAVDGETGLALVEVFEPDLVVLDIHMPSADGKRIDNGMEVLRQIKLKPNPPAVVMLSNFGDVQYREQCRRWGADAFLDKSNEFILLIDVVQELLDQRRSNASPV